MTDVSVQTFSHFPCSKVLPLILGAYLETAGSGVGVWGRVSSVLVHHRKALGDAGGPPFRGAVTAVED